MFDEIARSEYSKTPIYRAGWFIGPDSFPPGGPVNRGSTVFWSCDFVKHWNDQQ